MVKGWPVIGHTRITDGVLLCPNIDQQSSDLRRLSCSHKL